MAWKKGPMPPETWNWGGIVMKHQEHHGFYFADFHGDHAILYHSGQKVEAADIAQYDNSLELPPGVEYRGGCP